MTKKYLQTFAHILYKSKIGWQEGYINHRMDDFSIVCNENKNQNILIANNKIIDIKELPSKYKNKSLAAMDALLWRWFSLYIRLLYADENGMVRCCTCNKLLYWREIQAGHFISRRHKSTKFSEKNVHPQCAYCNKFLHGNQYLHGQYIDYKYGKGTADKLIQESKQLKKFNKLKYAALIQYYTKEVTKLAALRKQKI